MTVTSAQTNQVFLDVYREDASGPGKAAESYATLINAGVMTFAQFKAQLVAGDDAQHGTAPRLAVSNYLNGVTDSSSVLDSGAAFCRGQYAAYQAQGVANPELGPYEALGSGFCNTTQFASKISGKTNAQIWQDAYTYAFAVTMGSAQIAHFDAQYSYFYNLYTTNGIGATQANLQALGAVVGQIIGFGGTAGATSAPLGVKLNTWLTNASNGSPSYGAAL